MPMMLAGCEVAADPCRLATGDAWAAHPGSDFVAPRQIVCPSSPASSPRTGQRREDAPALWPIGLVDPDVEVVEAPCHSSHCPHRHKAPNRFSCGRPHPLVVRLRHTETGEQQPRRQQEGREGGRRRHLRGHAVKCPIAEDGNAGPPLFSVSVSCGGKDPGGQRATRVVRGRTKVGTAHTPSGKWTQSKCRL